jgi:branched-chain amino acid transport system permease protein
MTAATQGPAGPRARWTAWSGRPEVRRVASAVGVGLGLALISGPKGNENDRWRGIRGSFLDVRVVWFVLGGVLLSLALNQRHRLGGALRLAVAPVDTATARYRADPRIRYAVLMVVLVLAWFLPGYLSPYWQRVLTDQVGVYVLLALGLNVVVGLAGLLDLGYIAFFAIGAYTTAYFTGKLPVDPPVVLNPFLVMPLAILAAMLAGALLGAPTLRLRGDYLAIVTLGFGEIVRIVAVNSDKITNGPQGAFGIPHFSAFGYHWTLDSMPYYRLLFVVILLVVFLFHRLEESRIGRFWTAIREDEVAAAASGIPTLRYKLLAFAIGASTSGFAGVIYASKIGFINPDNFPLLLSILVLTMVIFGGMGSMLGVILGAAALGLLPELMRDYVAAEDRYIYFGALLIVMMVFRPQGLVPSRRRAREIKLTEEGLGGADSLGVTPGAQA